MAFKTNSELYQKMQSEHDDEIDQALGKAQEIIDYRFKDKFVLWEALQCGAERSDVWVYKFKGRSRSQHGNKRLALIGDAVLRQVFTCVMFTDGYDPEAVQDAITLTLSNVKLAEAGRRYGLDVLIDRGTRHIEPVRRKAVAYTLEAIIGGVHQDSDHDEKIVIAVMQKLGIWPPAQPVC